MSNDESVTHWVEKMREGDENAARQLWHRFFIKLTANARHRLRGATLPDSDDEDIALSAFNSLCTGLREGRFQELHGREGLWRLLLVINARKVADLLAYHHRGKRDVGRTIAMDNEVVAAVVSREPTPEFAAEFADQLVAMLGALEHEDLQQVALLKMEGCTNEEIAVRLQRSASTVERKLRTIRQIWIQTSLDS